MALVTKKLADRRGDDIALTDETGTRTFLELDERTNRVVNGLRAAGIEPGDTISLLCGNRNEYFEVMAACGHAGVFCVPVNWHWTAEELAYVVSDSDSRAFLVDSQFADVASDAVARLDEPLELQLMMDDVAAPGFAGYEDFLQGASADEPDDQRMGGPMFYTSGTTGFPKGVRTSSLNSDLPADLLELVAGGIIGALHLPQDGRTFLCGPAYHSAQWAWSLLPLLAGSSVVMVHKFDPAEALRIIDEHQITNVHLVPTQFIRLLKLPDETKQAFDGSSLEVVWHGAAPCSPQVKRDMIDWLGPKIWEYYGGTEGGIISGCSSEEWLERPGTLGKYGAGYDIKILDDDGNEQPTGQAGQIWFKQKSGADFEYHNAPEKTKSAHRSDGYGTLGDIGYLDDDGYIYLSDRKIDMIISGGVNIYPAEIEGCLVTHPAVRDAAVFGIPHDEMGEEVKGAVELSDGFEPSAQLEKELIAHVRAHLAGYKAPRSIDFEESFPRHPTGKLYKRLLRDPYWEGAGRSI